MSKGKGSAFERRICKMLSDWWLGTESDDVIFWRTAGSGGRATSRTKSGKKTNQAHCGDIACIDERGKPLTDLITFELKKGYPTATLHALLDAPITAAAQTYHQWVDQAVQSKNAAGTWYWAIIHQRDRREAVITIPDWLWCDLDIHIPCLYCHMGVGDDLRSCQLDEFLLEVCPNTIRTLVKEK